MIAKINTSSDMSELLKTVYKECKEDMGFELVSDFVEWMKLFAGLVLTADGESLYRQSLDGINSFVKDSTSFLGTEEWLRQLNGMEQEMLDEVAAGVSSYPVYVHIGTEATIKDYFPVYVLNMEFSYAPVDDLQVACSSIREMYRNKEVSNVQRHGS